MKKNATVQLVSAFLIIIAFTACSINPPQTNTPLHAMDSGVLMPSQKDIQKYKAGMQTIVQVNPNKLWLQRIGEAQNSITIDQLKETVTVPSLTYKANSRDLTAKAQSTTVLPKFVDNSTLPSFPQVGSQGLINSCVAFSTAYYQFSHEIGLKFGFNNTSGPNSPGDMVFSPKWSYNYINNGQNGPTWTWDSYNVMMSLGCALWDDFPYIANDYPPQNYLAWNLDERIQRKALNYRVKDYGSIPVTDTLAEIKGYLANGHVLSFNTYIGSWVTTPILKNPASSIDSAYVNKNGVIYQRSDYQTAHSLTIVGYNDDIWLDINNDGIIQPSELGGFIAVNSWGNGWENNGKIIISYDAVRQNSTAGAPANRTALFTFNEVYYIDVDQYNPRYLARLQLNQANRNQLTATLGYTKGTTSTTYSAFLDSFGGPYSFAGDNTAVDGVFFLDLSDTMTNSPDSLFMNVEDGNLNSPTTVEAFQFIDSTVSLTNNSADCPSTFDDNLVKFNINLLALQSIPNSPINLNVSSLSSSSFTLNWGPASPGISGFKIFISTNSTEPASPAYILGPNANSQFIQGLTPGTLYTLWIVEVNNAGNSIPQILQVRTLPNPINSSSPSAVSSAYSTTVVSSSSSQLSCSSKSVYSTSSQSSSSYQSPGYIRIETVNNGSYPLSNTLFPRFYIDNIGQTAINLSTLKIRYYYTVNGDHPQYLWCDYTGVLPSGVPLDPSTVSGVFYTITPAKPGADYFVEISFSLDAGSLNPGETLNLQLRVNKEDWSSYDQSDDYSYNPSLSYTIWSKITATLNGALVWGTAP